MNLNYIIINFREIKNYYKLLGKAFSPDYNIAFQGSIELAVSCGIDEVDILKMRRKLIITSPS